MSAVYDVAPHAGAWIETGAFHHLFPGEKVAPHAGAWIETSRGVLPRGSFAVAPHAGAPKHSFVVRTNIAYEKSLTIFIVRP